MLFVLMSLESTLRDEECQRAELRRSRDGYAQGYFREDKDAWTRQDDPGAHLDAARLTAELTAAFGDAFDELHCMLANEEIVYQLDPVRRAVKMLRQALPIESVDAGPHREAWQALCEALGIPKSSRKHKLQQATRFALMVAEALEESGKAAVRLFDAACGRSYLGFVLVHILQARGLDVSLHGVDSNDTLTGTCQRIQQTLGWTNARFEAHDLATYQIAPDTYDVLVALHACDTLTDEAIRLAITGRVPHVFLAPCCQKEFRELWHDTPLDWLLRHGVLEERLADVLTDSLRVLVLEAVGYRVRPVRFAAPDITPKNLLIHATYSGDVEPARFDEAKEFCNTFHLHPRIMDILEANR